MNLSNYSLNFSFFLQEQNTLQNCFNQTVLNQLTDSLTYQFNHQLKHHHSYYLILTIIAIIYFGILAYFHLDLNQIIADTNQEKAVCMLGQALILALGFVLLIYWITFLIKF